MYTFIPAAYIFTHQYLNTMQQGIQSLHATTEILATHPAPSKGYDTFMNWATVDKTVVILNAGSGTNFDSNRISLERSAKHYKLPYAEFSEPDINGMITAFGFILNSETIDDINADQKMLCKIYGENYISDTSTIFGIVSSLKVAK
jgi:hypothetical protein